MRKNRNVPAVFTSVENHDKARLRLEIAETIFARQRGLSKRPALEPDTGMLFPKVGAFWMKGMRFPLDLVYLDREMCIVETVRMSLDRGLLPRVYRPSARNVRMAVELPVGWLAEHGISLGDRLKVHEEMERGERGPSAEVPE